MFFFTRLQYFTIATLDSKCRPWASILTGKRGFIRPLNENHLAIATELSEGDPVFETLKDGWTVAEGARIVAGLGIDLTNRKRDKGNQTGRCSSANK
jgi:uncharacterized protein